MENCNCPSLDHHMRILSRSKDHEISIKFGYGSGAWFVRQDLLQVSQMNLNRNDVQCFLAQRWGSPFRLELGSGRVGDRPPWGKMGCATLDINPSAGPNADLYKDLEIDWLDCFSSYGEAGLSIPLPDECVSSIHANQVLEHIQNLIPLMNDCYRILIPGGIMKIGVPYYLGPHAWGDPTHVRAFSELSFQYYCRRGDQQFVDRFCDYGITAMFVQESSKKTGGNAGLQVVLRKPKEDG